MPIFLLSASPFSHTDFYPVFYVPPHARQTKPFTICLALFPNPNVTFAMRVMQQLKHVGHSTMVQAFGIQSQKSVLFGSYNTKTRLSDKDLYTETSTSITPLIIHISIFHLPCFRSFLFSSQEYTSLSTLSFCCKLCSFFLQFV